MTTRNLAQSERMLSTIRGVLANRRRLSPLADEIGAMIVAGELLEGAALSEKMFGVSRGVSRTSFREAVKVLEGKGMIRSRQNTGTQVAPRRSWHLLDPDLLAWRISAGNITDFIRDFFAFRQNLEPLAAESAAERQDQPAIEHIREALVSMQGLEANDPFGADYVAADVKFHQAVFQASANEFLIAMGHILEVPLTVSFTLHSSLHVGPANRLVLHEEVLNQIAAGNEEGAKAASLALLRDVSHHVYELVAEEPAVAERSTTG